MDRPAPLREVSQHQIGLLPASRFDALDLDPNVLRRAVTPLGESVPALRSPMATALTARLRKRGVWTDARGDVLRYGASAEIFVRRHSRCGRHSG